MSDGSPFQQLADDLARLRHDYPSSSAVGHLFPAFASIIRQAAKAAHYPIVQIDLGAAEARVLDHLTSMNEPTDFAASGGAELTASEVAQLRSLRLKEEGR